MTPSTTLGSIGQPRDLPRSTPARTRLSTGLFLLAYALVSLESRAVGAPMHRHDVEVFANFKVAMGMLNSLSGEADMIVPLSPIASDKSRLTFSFSKPFRFSIENHTEKTRITYQSGQAWIVFQDQKQAVNLDLGGSSEQVVGFFDMFRFSSFVEGVLFSDIQSHFIVEVIALNEQESHKVFGTPSHRLRFDCREDSVYRWGLGLHHVDVWIRGIDSTPTCLKIFTTTETPDVDVESCRIEIQKLDYNARLQEDTFEYSPGADIHVMGAYDVLKMFVQDALSRSVQKAVGLFESWKIQFKSYLDSPWGLPNPGAITPGSAANSSEVNKSGH